MSKVFKSIVGFAIISSAIGLTAVPAKAESKVSQCQRFDQSMTTFMHQLDNADHHQPPSVYLNSLLSSSEKELKQLQSRQFSDPKIRGFQQKALNTLVAFHNNVINAADAVDRHDRAGFDSAFNQVRSSVQPIKSLRKEFDNYCGQPK
jgi:hypothetical protein